MNVILFDLDGTLQDSETLGREANRYGFRLGIVSSKKRKYIVEELEAQKLDRYFEVIIAQEDTVEHKPAPAPLLLAAHSMNVEPAACMYVGDQPTDMIAAHQAGMWRAAALWGEGSAARLASANPDVLYENPLQLLDDVLGKSRRQGALGAFIFDMDGVIIDSEPLHFQVDQDVMLHYGVAVDKAELEPYVGMTNPEMWSNIIAKYNLSLSVSEMIEFQLQMKTAALEASDEGPIEGIMELIHKLHKRGIKIGLASSSPRLFIEAVLHKLGITGFFACIVSGEEVAEGKPAPDVYLEAARLLEASPARCMVLEDSRNGVAAAKSAGMGCIGYRNVNSGNQDLSQADYIVSSIKEINIDELM